MPKSSIDFRQASPALEQLRGLSDIFDVWEIKTDRKEIPVTVTQTAYSKYEVSFPEDLMGILEENLKDELNGGQKGRSGSRLKDVLLQIDYTGDIGSAFIDGDMIHDNFCNGDTWEIGLRTFAGPAEKFSADYFHRPAQRGRKCEYRVCHGGEDGKRGPVYRRAERGAGVSGL